MTLEEAIKSSKFKGERHKAVVNMLYTAYWLRNNFTVVLKTQGITLEQFNVLRILNGKHPEMMRVKDIGSRIVEKSSNVPRIIDRLAAKKLVKRNTSKEDKRETLVAITDAGLELLQIAIRLVDNTRETTLGITDEEALQLNELLEKLRNPEVTG
jgi:DNA-binding MarR family transcriptional regulator